MHLCVSVCVSLLQRGRTALHVAVRAAGNGHAATVTLLLDRGADIEAKDNVRHPNPPEDTVGGCMT